jgi:O-antigen ligase
VTAIAEQRAKDETAELERYRALQTAVLITLITCWVIIPRLLQSVLGPKVRASVTVQDASTTVSLATYTQRLLLYMTIAYCLWIIVQASRYSPKGRGFALLVFLLPCLYLWVRDIYLQQRAENTRVIFLLAVIAIWVLRPRLRSLITLGYLVGATVVICLLMGILLPSKGIFHSSQGTVLISDKQIFPIGLLVGVFSQENNLGQFIVMGLPSIFLIPRRKLRWMLVGLSILAVVWSSSRGSLLALGMVAVAALLLKVFKRHRAGAGFLIALAPIVLVCVLPFVTHDPLAYTTRGYIWQQSLLAWSDDKVFGLGSAWYRIVGTTSAALGATVFHGHNQLVQLLVTGGYVLAFLVGALLLLTLIRAVRLARDVSTFGVLYLVAFAGTCLLEVSLALVDNTLAAPVTIVPLAVIAFTGDLGKPDASSIS